MPHSSMESFKMWKVLHYFLVCTCSSCILALNRNPVGFVFLYLLRWNRDFCGCKSPQRPLNTKHCWVPSTAQCPCLVWAPCSCKHHPRVTHTCLTSTDLVFYGCSPSRLPGLSLHLVTVHLHQLPCPSQLCEQNEVCHWVLPQGFWGLWLLLPVWDGRASCGWSWWVSHIHERSFSVLTGNKCPPALITQTITPV